MFSKAFYIFLFIVLLIYLLTILFTKKEILLKNTKGVKVITLIFGFLLLINLLFINITNFNSDDLMTLLIHKFNFELILYLFVLTFIIMQIFYRIKYKDKFFNILNIFLIIYLVISLFITLFSLTITGVNLNDDYTKLVIDDILYHKEIDIQDIKEIGLYQKIPAISKDYIYVLNRFAYKGLCKDVEGNKILVLDSFASTGVIDIKTVDDYISIGYNDEQSIQFIVGIINSLIGTGGNNGN